ncbi:hypothetical protein N2603_39365 [Bradyrhizobium huanghuaihaiense]|uniref:hypothetical protein n=1 Tax=Bradyrhizobium huanghuaihaiense TaxID=990078 RepID=UPI0021AAAF1A|nr:hypothetical protein [Bradyrhizobium sp. CB3035]UWU75935.1 hypothetical protein N2603_39365 [Bradyrhizobium sp. CB3035]
MRSGQVTLLEKREDVPHHLNEAAISALIRVVNRYVGSRTDARSLSGLQSGADGRELATREPPSIDQSSGYGR